ncbi:hypothetical protein [Streptomyces flaveus]|uniref:hypothetical protein n=1 Tax=Streptomyces flaveus TaxID=66370 RepID=UPI003318B194
MVIRRAMFAAAAALVLAWFGTADASGEPPGPYEGHSFNSATEISGGAVVKRELAVGDMLFWRLDLQPGQSIDVQASVTVPAGYDTGRRYERLGVAVYDPVRQPVWCKGDDHLAAIDTRHAMARIGGTFRADCSLGNLADRDNAVQMAGTYYVQVGVGLSTVNRGTMLPMQLTIEVGNGVAAEPEGSASAGIPPPDAAPPAVGTSSPAAQATALPAQEPAGHTLPGPLFLTGAAATLGAALAWIAVMHRRHQRNQGPPPGGSPPADEATVGIRAAGKPSAPGNGPSQSRIDDATVRVRATGAEPQARIDPREAWHQD